MDRQPHLEAGTACRLRHNVNAASYGIGGLGAMPLHCMIDDILRLLSNSIFDK